MHIHSHTQSTSIFMDYSPQRPFRGGPVVEAPPPPPPPAPPPPPVVVPEPVAEELPPVVIQVIEEAASEIEVVEETVIEETPPLYKRALRFITPDNTYGKTALVGAAALGALALLGYHLIPMLFEEATIPETSLSGWITSPIRNHVINSSPFDYKSHFHEDSAIGKTLAYLANSINIEVSVPMLFGNTQFTLTQKDNPDISFVCSKLSDTETACELQGTVSHIKGALGFNIKEKINPLDVDITETLYVDGEEHVGSYKANGLPDAFTQLAAPWNYQSNSNSNGDSTLPLLFKRGKNLADTTS